MYKKQTVIILLFLVGLYACKKGLDNPFLGFQKPSNFPEPAYRFSTNEVTKAGFELGRKLFYDPILSHNNTISCASCHISYAAFSHPGHNVSHGIHDRLGTRNSPPIMNLAWSTSFMWDGGIFDLDLQPIAPITNHVEMDDTMANVLNRLRISSVYPPLFEQAFGDRTISGTHFLKALSQFMVMCISSHSKYDSVMRKEGIQFSPIEEAGYALFQQKCASCHQEPLFTNHAFVNNGLPISALNDQGRYGITLDSNHRYQFKVPSLRNIGYTTPYMHDGRFSSVEQVLDFYNSGVQKTPNLASSFNQNGRLGISISAAEKTKLVAFLKTLDDVYFVRDKTLVEP